MSIDVKTYPGKTADQRGWGPGWPHDNSANCVPLVAIGVSFPAGVHRDLHDLFVMLLEESEARGYIKLHAGWCWGYFGRYISGSTVPSNHSWGLAGDINAPENPYTYDPHAAHTIGREMANLWNAYGFRWGGDYPTHFDYMHFEFMGTPADAKRLTAKARKAGLGMALTNAQEQTLKEAQALIAALTKGIRSPDGTPSSPGGAGARIAAAVNGGGASVPPPVGTPKHVHTVKVLGRTLTSSEPQDPS